MLSVCCVYDCQFLLNSIFFRFSCFSSVFIFRENIKIDLILTTVVGFGVFYWISLSGFYILLPPLIMSYICKLFEMIRFRLLDLNRTMDQMSDDEMLDALADIIKDHLAAIE